MTEATGKSITMKDIHNIGTQYRKATNQTARSFRDIADFLKTQPNLLTEYVVNEDDNTLIGIFIQEIEMQHVFDKFPEVLLVDATHKTNDMDFPLYSAVVIAGNEATETAAGMLVVNEDEESIRKMFQIFKSKNPRWTDIKVVITDKDMTKQNVISSEIPNAHVCTMYSALFVMRLQWKR